MKENNFIEGMDWTDFIKIIPAAVSIFRSIFRNKELEKNENKSMPIQNNENAAIQEWQKKVSDWEEQHKDSMQTQADNVCHEISSSFLVKALEYNFTTKHLYVYNILREHDAVTIGILTELEIKKGIKNIIPYLEEFYNKLLENDVLYKWICQTPQIKRDSLEKLVKYIDSLMKIRFEDEKKKYDEYILKYPELANIFSEENALRKYIALNEYYEPIIEKNAPKVKEFIQNSKVKYYLLNMFYKIIDEGPNVLKEFLNMPYLKQEQELKRIENLFPIV